MPQCECITNAGARCKRNATKGRFCGQHQGCTSPIGGAGPAAKTKAAKPKAVRKAPAKPKAKKIPASRAKSPSPIKVQLAKGSLPPRVKSPVKHVSPRPTPKITKYRETPEELNISVGKSEVVISAHKSELMNTPLRINWPSFGGVSLERAREFYHDLGHALILAEDYEARGY
jgi:hypothetical protein